MNHKDFHSDPPRFLQALMVRFLGSDAGEDTAWDFWELYRSRVTTDSRWFAAVRLGFDIFSILIRPRLWNRENRPVMIGDLQKAHLTLALRRFRNTPGFSSLNALGLGTGLACVLLIFLFVRHQSSFDSHVSEPDRTFRVTMNYAEGQHWAPIGPPVGPAMASQISGIETMARFFPSSSEVLFKSGDVQYFESNGGFADSTWFTLFPHDFLSGNPEGALERPGTMVISERLARKFFGRVDVLGESLEVPGEGISEITGVFAPPAVPTHVPVDYLFAMSTFYSGNEDWLGGARTWASMLTYVRLEKGVGSAAVQRQLPSFVDNFYEGITEGPASEAGELILQPVRDIHLQSHLEKEYRANGNASQVYAFSIIAIVVLLVAIVNFINLTTARATDRLKEVAVRKTFGARRNTLLNQLFVESILGSFSGLFMGVVITLVLLPQFNGLTGQEETWLVLLDPTVAFLFVGVTLFSGIVSGVYPAVLISGFNAVEGLRGSSSPGSRGALIRKSLVTFQFAVSIALIVGTVAIWNQLHFMANLDLGFDKEHVISVRMGTELDEIVSENPETIRNLLVQKSGIISVSQASDAPGERYSLESFRLLDGSDEDGQMMRVAWTSDHDYVDALGLELKAGRTFSRAAPTDSTAWVINESAAGRLGYGPEGVIGQILVWNDYEGPIVGVVADFNFASLHSRVEPLVIPLRPGNGYQLLVRYSAAEEASVLDHLEETIASLAPSDPFIFTFLSDRLDGLYETESRLTAVITWFAGLAILVAIFGLFGLAAHAVSRRIREIGIRQVLGATTSDILSLLSRQFLMLIVVGFLLGGAASWVALSAWLEGYAYREEIGVGPFAAAGLVVCSLAFLTIAYHVVQAIRKNPVDSIRTA